MAVTIKDVARRAGVSHSTVSRALQGSTLISAVTTERIRKAALELGYHPSAAARSLKTNSTRVIGVAVSSIDDPFFGEILQGIEDIAQANGYGMFMTTTQHRAERQQAMIQVLREHRVDGVIICSTSFGPEESKQFSEQGIPMVVINNQAAEDYRYSISHDDVDGSRQVTRHLIDLGHERIAYLGNSLSGRTTQDRLSGYQQEMAAAGLPLLPEYIYQAPGSSPENALKALDYFLDLPHRPTAVVCFNDMLAIGLLKGAQQAGYQVPEDLSIAGFDNIVFSAYTNPPLTTFDQPKRFIGTEAAKLLLGLLKSPKDDPSPSQPKIRLLKGRLLVRKSSASPGKW